MNNIKDGERILIKQLDSLWGITEAEIMELEGINDSVALRLKKCFSHIKNKYYSELLFDPYHSCQYAYLLYYYANELYRRQGINKLSDKIYCTLKINSSMDMFYQIDMPEVFFFDHPVGTVLGRAEYGNNFYFTQNCTVGNNNGIYPCIGENVFMMSGAKILGNCKIGNNVVFGANSYVLDTNIPDDSIVYGEDPRKLKIIQNKERVNEIINTYFK